MESFENGAQSFSSRKGNLVDKAATPTLMWIDLRQNRNREASLAEQFRRFCDVRLPGPHSDLSPQQTEAGIRNIDVLIFDFDYPDIDSLNILRHTHQQFPDLPILMLTLHHTEELAIWALRNRVWDYYYKPLNARQINDIGLSLLQWFRKRGESPSADQQFLGNGYPDEVRFRHAVEAEFNITLATNYVEKHLAEKITEDAVANLYGISRFQFSRKFKKACGMTFQDFLLSSRIDHARKLIKNPSAQIVDIAFAVGFTDAAYFTRVFKRHTGCLPSQLRQMEQSL